jgi:hypothetical protein
MKLLLLCGVAVLLAGLALGSARAGHAPPLEYSTYFGGQTEDCCDGIAGIAVDHGDTYVTGCTSATDLPTTAGAFQPAQGGGFLDGYVAKFAKDGSLVYATYFGGSGDDCAQGIAVDDGEVVFTGGTSSEDLPTTADAFQPALGGGEDAFVARLDRTGSRLLYGSYLGGPGDDEGHGIALDGKRMYVTGTGAPGFPTTTKAVQQTGGGGVDGFVTALDRHGAVYSTLLGGSGDDEGNGVAVENDHAFVTGFSQSPNFPTTPGSFQPCYRGGGFDGSDAFVAELAADGSRLRYSSYLGGDGHDGGTGIAVHNGRAYVTGGTGAHDFPTTPRAYQPAYGGGILDAFVTEVDPGGAALVFSTYLGAGESNGPESGDDEATAIALDGGRAVVTGTTNSADFPTTADALQPTLAGSYDGFVSELGPSGGTLPYSTFFGGTDFDHPNVLAAHAGRVYVGGFTFSTDFPTTVNAFQPAPAGGSDGFVSRLRVR